MKKTKIIKNPVFTFMLGIVISGSVGVLASSILASNVEYKNTTVDKVLDSLYQTATTTVTNLQQENTSLQQSNSDKQDTIDELTSSNIELSDQVSSLQTTLANITGVSAYGDFTTTDTTTVHTIPVGFKPSKILFVIPSANAGFYEQWFYDSSLSINEIKGCWGQNDTGGGCATHPTSLFGLSTTNTGFTYKAPGILDTGHTYWYAIK